MPLSNRLMKLFAAFASCSCMVFIGCSNYHAKPPVTNPLRADTDLFEASGIGEGGERQLFTSKQNKTICAFVDNTGNSSLDLSFIRSSSKDGEPDRTLEVLPGQSNRLCQSANNIVASCGEGCDYRWRIETGILPDGPQNIAAPLSPKIRDCEYDSEGYSKNSIKCQEGKLFKCSGDAEGSWFAVESGGAQETC